MKKLIIKILREETEWFEQIVDEYDESSPSFAFNFIEKKLKNKKSYNNYDYLIHKDKNFYRISEKIETRLSHYLVSIEDDFNLNTVKEELFRVFNSNMYSDRLRKDYKKLYQDIFE